jgi:hypothetical protein
VSSELNDDNVADQVEQAVQVSQDLDGWKQQILADMAAKGGDAADTNIIIAHRLPNGDITATDV